VWPRFDAWIASPVEENGKMSILGSIVSSILGGRTAPPPQQPPPQQLGGFRPAETASTATPPPRPQPSAEGPVGATPPAAPGAREVDIAAVLDKLAADTKQKLNWRTSIVDLMKLLKLDSSPSARKKLAQELSYTGDTGDSAAMNVWLHKQVMRKLSEHGGKVPAELKH
jgi:hypothetical protein